MYSALDIAKYIIDYSYDRNNSVSNLRLQKILYFVQAEFLVATGHPCFEETIQAWEYGPVVPEVYREYKIFGSSSIFSEGRGDKFYFIRNADKEMIEDVVQTCEGYSTVELVDLTHKQDPWLNVHTKPCKDITNDSIKKFFTEE